MNRARVSSLNLLVVVQGMIQARFHLGQVCAWTASRNLVKNILEVESGDWMGNYNMSRSCSLSECSSSKLVENMWLVKAGWVNLSKGW